MCGHPAVGHHWDYSQLLDVIWLCQKHHVEEHWRLGVGTVRMTEGAVIGISEPLREQIARVYSGAARCQPGTVV